MFDGVFSKVFGSANERRIRKYLPRVAAINALEPELAALSDEELKARTAELKKQVEEAFKKKGK